jgi:hypothetical protein
VGYFRLCGYDILIIHCLAASINLLEAVHPLASDALDGMIAGGERESGRNHRQAS